MAPRIPYILRPSLLRPLSVNPTHIPKPPLSYPSQNPNPISDPNPSFPSPKPSPFATLSPFFLSSRTFSSSPSSSNMVIIESEEGFNTALKKVQDEKLPAVFYFTAVWCGPCRFLSPVIEEMSTAFPHVTTYKIDIDKEGLAKTLSQQKIYSVPTLHFFQDGIKADEMVGADVAKVRDNMEKFYKKQ